MTTTKKPLSFHDATFSAEQNATPDVKAWQDEKVKRGLKEADEGRFASPEAVKKVVQNSSRMDEIIWTDQALQNLNDTRPPAPAVFDPLWVNARFRTRVA